MSDIDALMKDLLEKSTLSQLPQGPLPVNFGIVIFPGFQALDAFGSLDALNTLSTMLPLNLSVLAATLDPVTTHVPSAANRTGSNFGQSINPTHTFSTPPDLDVLLIPGGVGVLGPNIQTAIDFVAKTYPSLKYLITVCNGAAIAAAAGVLDGKRATTNKMLWESITAQRPQVKWVSHARWVVDGNVWTASGVSSGLDCIFAFIKEVYGNEAAEKVSNGLEYERHEDSSWDPYAELYNLPKTNA